MESLTTQKVFQSKYLKATEDFEVSPFKKEKNKENLSDLEENPFSFSFSSFLPNDTTKAKKSKRVQFGLNLLKSFQSRLESFAFGKLQKYKPLSPSALRLFQWFNSKKKRAAFLKWYVQSIKITSEHKVAKAMTTLTHLNSYSRKYISCTLIFSVFSKHLQSFSTLFFSKISLPKVLDKWMSSGLLILIRFFEKKKILQKSSVFKVLNNDISLQRKVFIQNTDRCIILSEQLFEAKEAKEKAEFEKEEVTAVLESKTDELNNLLDVLEEYKAWQGKLASMEKVMNEEVQHWKAQASRFQVELEKKNKEIIEVYSDKKKAEEECLKAYRNLDLAQRQNLEYHQKYADFEMDTKKECEKCGELQGNIETYNELIEEFKKTEEKYIFTIKELQEQVSRPVSVISSKSKTKPVKKPVKKTLEFDKTPISETENQFAVEIVNLHKQLNKLKHENRTISEIFKKCQHERDELRKLMSGKDEALSRLRKENDQLSISLSADHYKSIHKLEYHSSQYEQQCKDLVQELEMQKKSLEDLKKTLEAALAENDFLKIQLKEVQKPPNESQKLVESLSSLQSHFARLKEMSDRQMQTIENLKQENYQLMQSVESYKSFARSSKLHADKATGDAEAYAELIKKMETELQQAHYSKESAENEVQVLKQHLMKLLNSR